MSTSAMLLSKVLSGSEYFMEARKGGITDRAFLSPDDRSVWTLVDLHFQKHTNVPELSHIRKLVPAFTPMDTGKRTISELIEKLRKERVEVEILTRMNQVRDLLTLEKFSEAIGLMYQGASAASRGWGLSRDVSVSGNKEAVLQHYLSVKSGGIMRGVPWPWEPLNQATGGITAGTYNILYGRMKSTKTFRLLQVAIAARNHGKRVLVASCEMDDFTMLKRLAAIELELDYDAFSRGLLTDEDEKRFREYIHNPNSSAQEEIHITQLTDSADGRSVSALRSKIAEHTPDLVLVDSMYKMVDEQTGKRDGSPQTIRNVSYDLQQLAQVSRLPFVVTTQANRKGQKARIGDTSDVAFSDAFAMDCDLLLRLVNDSELHRTIFLVQAARETMLDGFSVGNRMCSGMGPVQMEDGTYDWSIPAKHREGEDSGDSHRAPVAASTSRFQ